MSVVCGRVKAIVGGLERVATLRTDGSVEVVPPLEGEDALLRGAVARAAEPVSPSEGAYGFVQIVRLGVVLGGRPEIDPAYRAAVRSSGPPDRDREAVERHLAADLSGIPAVLY